MKTISIILLVCTIVLAINLNNNVVQAADEDSFEEGKYNYLILIREKGFAIFAFAHFFNY
jgi:hypothetical protein